MLGLPVAVRESIRALDEHWDGGGYPHGLQADAIPLAARVMALAQTVKVFHAAGGPEVATNVAIERSGSWFDPEIVGVLRGLHREGTLWRDLGHEGLLTRLLTLEPVARVVPADDGNLDRVARVFSWVIDAKSPWTLLHSENVARIARGIACELGLPAAGQRRIFRAGLLHDIGKLAVSNLILDKPGRLDADEWSVLREHPAHTRSILAQVACFGEFAETAGAHHERLDGEGYDRGLGAEELDLTARVLATADRFEAMSAYRPYRGEIPVDDVLGVLSADRGTGVCHEVFEALEGYLARDEALAPGSLAAARRTSVTDRLKWLETSRELKPAATNAPLG